MCLAVKFAMSHGADKFVMTYDDGMPFYKLFFWTSYGRNRLQIQHHHGDPYETYEFGRNFRGISACLTNLFRRIEWFNSNRNK